MKASNVRKAVVLVSILAVPAIAAQVLHPPSSFSPELDAKIAKQLEVSFGNKSMSDLIKAHMGEISLPPHDVAMCQRCKIVFGPAGSEGKPSYLRLIYTPQIEQMGGMPPASTPAPLLNKPPAMINAVGNSSLIVMGVPVAMRYLSTERNDDIYTEYAVSITRIFKGGNRVRGQLFDLVPGNTIIVVKRGGKLTVDGVPVTSINTDFPPIGLNTPYIFALGLIRETGGAFYASGEWTYRIENGIVSVMSKEAAKTNPPEELPTFIEQLQTVVADAVSKGI